MIREIFIAGDSPLHSLDPRLRVCIATGFASFTAIAARFEVLALAMGFGMVLAVLARLPLLDLARRMLWVNGLIFFLWLVLPLTTPGTIVLAVGPLALTQEGLLLSARITLKSNAILLVFISLVGTLSVGTLGHTLARLRVPDKLVHLLLISYRYIFVLEQEYGRLARAARMRGFVPKTGLHTYRTYAYLFGMLFVRAAARAERVHQAMICRGFMGRFYSLTEFSFTAKDGVWAAAMVLPLLLAGWLEWGPIR